MTKDLGKTVIRAADLPKFETETGPIIDRLSDFLKRLRQRGTEGEQARTDAPPPDDSEFRPAGIRLRFRNPQPP